MCSSDLSGTIDCGLFKCGDGKGENNIAVKFPKAELHELASVDFDYYHSSITIPLQISDCKTLLNKMIEIDETVTWTNANSREDRIQRFKNIIDEYNNCKTN